MSNQSEERELKRWEKKAIELLIDTDEIMSQKDIATSVGISASPLSEVMNHDPVFQKAYKQAVDEFMQKTKPKIDSVLTRKASSGDTSAIRLYYERVENLQNKVKLVGEDGKALKLEVDVL